MAEAACTLTGELTVSKQTFAIVVSRFNEFVSSRLLGGAIDTLTRHGCQADNITVMWVPGAWELPLTAQKAASTGKYDAIICLGCVIRGETAHFDYVAGEANYGLGNLARTLDVPLLFGVLTTETHEQAWARASRDQDDKGREVALGALHMVALYSELEE